MSREPLDIATDVRAAWIATAIFVVGGAIAFAVSASGAATSRSLIVVAACLCGLGFAHELPQRFTIGSGRLRIVRGLIVRRTRTIAAEDIATVARRGERIAISLVTGEEIEIHSSIAVERITDALPRSPG